MSDTDIDYVHRQIDRLSHGGFYGQLIVKFLNGRVSSVKQEEALALPSFKLRKSANNAGGQRNETQRQK